MNNFRIKWFIRLFVPFLVGLVVIVFVFININGLLNFTSYRVLNFNIYEKLIISNKYFFYFFTFLCLIFIIGYFFKSSREFILSKLLEKRDYQTYKIQSYLINNKSIFSLFELENRLNQFSFKGLKKAIIFGIIILSLFSFFSFKRFTLNTPDNPLDFYLQKLNVNTDKKFYLEGDSIFIISDYTNSDLTIEYGQKISKIDLKKKFIGIATADFNRILFKYGLRSISRDIIIYKRPQLKDVFIQIHYNQHVINEFKNIFDIQTFSGSTAYINAVIQNSKNKSINKEIQLFNDTILRFYYCNDFGCDSFSLFFKVNDLSSPLISHILSGDKFIVRVSDGYGLKTVKINNQIINTKPEEKIIEIFLDTLGIYRVFATNIFNKFSEVTIGKSNDYSGISSLNSEEFNSFFNTIESEIIENILKLSETSDYYERSLSLDRLNELSKILDNLSTVELIDFNNKVKINNLQQLLKDVNTFLENVLKDKNDQSNLIEMLKSQNLKNTLNRYKKNKKSSEATNSESINTSLNSADQIILEYILIVSNKLSIDIEQKKFRNKNDIFNNSVLPIILDTLKMIMDKKPPIYDALIEDYTAIINSRINKSSDLNTLVYRLNNISVTLYNIIKNIESNSFNNLKNQSEKDKNSDCNNPGSGNTQKPTLKDLIGESESGEGEGKDDNSEKGEGNKLESGKSDNSTDSKKSGDNKNTREKEKKENSDQKNRLQNSGIDSESLEDLEKRLRDVMSDNPSIDKNELRRRIKWLDYNKSKKMNEEIDNRRKGNFVIEVENERKGVPKQANQFKYIQRDALRLKNEIVY